MNSRDVWWLGTGAQAYEFSDLSTKLGGFVGASVLIAHRPKASDSILYNFFLQKALAKNSTVFFPLKEPYHLPGNAKPIDIKLDKIESRKRYLKGRVYRVLTDSYEVDAPKLLSLYKILLSTNSTKTPTSPFAIVFDTLKRWTPALEDHIRFLLREAPLVQGSIWLHCPLSNIPPDLLSVFGNVIIIWPSQHEIELLNSHFPSEKIPLPGLVGQETYNNRMLVFKSKPLSERGWEWKKFSSNE